MTAPAVRPESATLPTNALGYVDIVNIDPPAGYVVPTRADADVQALLARAAERRAPDEPLRVVPTATGFALADMDSYRRWWVLRHTGSGIGQVKAEWVVVVEDDVSDAPAAAEPVRPTMPAAPRSTSPVRIALDSLIVDPGLQTRAAMNDATVAEYAEALLAGEVLPPVVVFRDGDGMWLADGFHRVAAAKQAGLADIEAIVHDGGRREALLHAVGANARHGLRRTNADKRRAVEMLLADAEWNAKSSNWIAQTCGVSQPFVAQVRESTSNRLKYSAVATVDGRIMDTANIGRKPASVQAGTSPEVPECPAVDPVANRLIEANRRPPASVPANDDTGPTKDDTPAITPPANDDAEGGPDARLLAELDAAGATFVRQLAALAVDHPAAAREFVDTHVAAINAALNRRR